MKNHYSHARLVAAAVVAPLWALCGMRAPCFPQGHDYAVVRLATRDHKLYIVYAGAAYQLQRAGAPGDYIMAGTGGRQVGVHVNSADHVAAEVRTAGWAMSAAVAYLRGQRNAWPRIAWSRGARPRSAQASAAPGARSRLAA
jgi:hypothetical protein